MRKVFRRSTALGAKRACRRRPRRVRRGVRDREHEAQDGELSTSASCCRTRSRRSAGCSSTHPAFKAAFAKAGVKASINNALNDPLKQKAQAQACLAAGAKVVIETSLDNGSAASIEKLFTSKGGKAIDYDRLVLGGTASVYVSFDGTSVGRAQASGVIAAMKAKGTYKASSTIAQLWGGQTDQNAFWFKSGNDAVFNPLFKSKALKKGPQQFVPDWDANNAATIFSQMLVKTSNNIQGIIAANDNIAGAVIADLKAKHLQADPAERPGCIGSGRSVHPRRLADRNGLQVRAG